MCLFNGKGFGDRRISSMRTVYVGAGLLAFSGKTYPTLAAGFDRAEFRLERVWKTAAKPARAFRGKETNEELGLSYLAKQKLRTYMVTFPCIYRKEIPESEESNFS